MIQEKDEQPQGLPLGLGQVKVQLKKRKRPRNSSKTEVCFGLDDVREKILRKQYSEAD